jgi:mono/diheme cytochrome c family protein
MERGLRPGRVLALVAAALAALLVTACGSQSATTASDNLVQGKQLFVSRCGGCHTLARASTKGTVGPDLDAAFRRSLADGMERSVVHGVVAGQIRHPNRTGKMPAGLVSGQKVDDVAAYVAVSVAKAGQDTGVLATAVKPAGSGKPAVESNGTLEIDADPSGQLAYVTVKATAQAGKVTLKMGNQSNIDHDIAIEGNGISGKGPAVGHGGVSQFSVDLKPGTYTYYCTLPGHRQAGMHGTLTVK